MTKRLIIIESPFSGDIPNNKEYARRCVKDSLLRGESPIASHLLYTQKSILDDHLEAEREMGILAGLAWCKVADAMAVYTDLGISKGMQQGIDNATSLELLIEYRTIK